LSAPPPHGDANRTPTATATPGPTASTSRSHSTEPTASRPSAPTHRRKTRSANYPAPNSRRL